MTDREKIVEGLSICIENIDRSCPLGCPYYDKCTNYEARFVFQPLLRDTLKLLKEHEPASPTWEQGEAYCGKCGQRLPRKKADREINYCWYCGRPVKWQ
jgi:hypothetical protein